MSSRERHPDHRPRPPSSPDAHVGEWLADYVFERLDERSARNVDEHVARCADCAADLEWVRRVIESRGSAAAQGAAGIGGPGERHLDAGRIVAIADQGSATIEEQRHLETCDSCRHELDVLRGVETPEEVLRAEAAHPVAGSGRGARGGRGVPSPLLARRRRRRAAPAVVSLLALAAVLLLMVQPWGGDLARLRDLSQREPLPVRITRTVPLAGSFEDARLRGMEAYRDGEYEKALGGFVEALELDPRSAELWLYRGSAELMLERTQDAAAHLRRAVELAGDPGVGESSEEARVDAALRDEARWQRVQALLALGDGHYAREVLGGLAEGEGHRAADAKALLEQMPRSR